MGFGVAIFQPALPTLVRLWAPTRTWLANAVSTNGMLMGATFASGADHSGRAAAGRRKLAARSPGLVGAGTCRGAALRRGGAAPAQPPTPRRNALPARWWPDWNSPTALAARHHARRQQRAVLRRQRLHAGLPHQHRPRRHDRHDARLAQRLAAASASFIMLAMAGAPAARELAVHDLRPGHDAGPARHRALRRHLDRGFGRGGGLRRGRDLHRHLRTAGDLEPARRRAPHGRRHVHHQLHHRGDRPDHLRRALGPHRIALDRVPADGAVRVG